MAINITTTITLLITFLLFSSLVHVTSLMSDAEILLRVKNHQIIDPENRLLNWVITHDYERNYTYSPCNWTGITCNLKLQVVSINLNNMSLKGDFPSGFCRVSTLRNLSIPINHFNGTIRTLAHCAQLHSLNINDNDFVGKLPVFTPEFTSIYSLDLSTNFFTGVIPASYKNLLSTRVLRLYGNRLNGPAIPEFLLNLTELTHLELAYNSFHYSRIPPTIGNLSKLEALWLTKANLVGKIPESICSLKHLQNFDVAINVLSGKIPTCIGNMSSLVQLELYANHLTGELPESLGNLRSLLFFDASQNALTGVLPESLAKLNLASLNLNDNFLHSRIPAVLAENKKLYQLKIFNNSFFGELPTNLGLNSALVEFDVSTNYFFGKLPENLCHGEALAELILFNNNFSGNLPAFFGRCKSLGYVRIGNNNFSGEVPRGFWNLPELYFVQIPGNSFSGTFPTTLSRKLTTIQIFDNLFSGHLPVEICHLKNLGVLELNDNKLSGELPKCLTQLTNLRQVNLAGNMFSEEIPMDVSSWKELTLLNLSRNKFSGAIPSQLGYIKVLSILDLSNNIFSGELPVELTRLKLSVFNVSNNNLEGQVPRGFNRKDYVNSLLGNPKLCSSDLKPLPPCPKHSPVSTLLIEALSILAFVLLFSLIWLCKPKLCPSSKGELQGYHSCKLTTFQPVAFNEGDLWRHLVENNLIGSGGSGQVYKVTFDSGQTVAVKKLWGGNRSSDMDLLFKSEVDILCRIRHVNIVKLLFSGIGEDFRVLGYEYMTNGSLGDVLYGEKAGGLLDWPRRYAIALGSAQGLAYLHHDCVPAIVHRDVKSNNILLDDEFVPRIADFGLAKPLVTPTGNEVRDVEAMSRIAGSCGYIAPEYGYTLRVTEKSDVYSFGVVLMELITGKRPNDPSFEENTDIVKWMTEKLLESFDLNSIDQLIDSRMNRILCNFKEIKKVIEVAVICTSAFPMNRPSMRRVVEMLKDRTKW